MRRPIIGLAAALLALALAPGAALGLPVAGALDQSADYGGAEYTFDSLAGVTQTVTPAHTGFLTHLQLYCDPGPFSVAVKVTVEGFTDSETCGEAGWQEFYMTEPVVAGVPFTITIDAGGTPIGLGDAAADYPGGAADCSPGGSAIVPATLAPVCPSDFAFKVYVAATAQTTYSWSAPSVGAGTSTAVTLTTQTAFADFTQAEPQVNTGTSPDMVVPANFYSMKLDALPSWFSPTGIACSAQVAPADCTVVKYEAGINPTGDGTAMTVVITMTGVASPAAGDVGKVGTASGNGCVNAPEPTIVVSPAATLSACAPGSATLTVGATLPPTSTVTAPVSGGSPVSPLIGFAAAALAGLLVAFRLESKRRRAARA